MKWLLSICCFLINLCAVGSHVLIDSTTQMIVKGKGVAVNIAPGDTIYLLPGTYKNLRLLNLKGTKEQPIIITNHPSGKAVINSHHYYGVSFNYCEYIHLSGTGNKNIPYGIEIANVNGNGIGGTKGSLGLTINNIYIHDVAGAGIQIKTDATCYEFNRSDYVIKDISIHNCLIQHVGTEGMYIGSTQYQPFIIDCEGKHTTLSDPMIQNLQIHSNHIAYTGWDGIQVASVTDASVYNNFIEFDSQATFPNQMSGIAIGAGATPSVFNNTIQFGNGNGISSFGLGGTKIYNNIILEPGFGFQIIYGEYGIYFNNKEDNLKKQQTVVAHNLILSANVGMKFDLSSPDSNNYYVYNNLIIQPRYLEHYTSINQTDKAYIQTPFLQVNYKGNVHLEELNHSWFEDVYLLNFNPTWESKVIDSGENFNIQDFKIDFDIENKSRNQGNKPDAGPFESPYQSSSNLAKDTERNIVFQNPVINAQWQWMVNEIREGTVEINLYNSKGIFINQWKKNVTDNKNTFTLNIPSNIENGMHLVTFTQGTKRISLPVLIQIQ